MRRAVEVKTSGTWSAAAIQSVTLPYDQRHRRRIRMIDDGGDAFLLDLADAVMLSDSDGLILDDGGLIEVRAAAEPVADIQCRDAIMAARIAWHIGNRHTPLQVLGDGALRIADDHVLVAMVAGLGATVTRRDAPFQPEAGAYAKGHGHSHDH